MHIHSFYMQRAFPARKKGGEGSGIHRKHGLGSLYTILAKGNTCRELTGQRKGSLGF